MSKVLYITANPNSVENSFSLSTGKAFIDAYAAANATDEVVHIDLYQEFIPHIDGEVFSGWGKLQSGSAFDALTVEEQKKVARLGELVDQFVEADKYVFATPMWNFSYPPIVKNYIDAVSVAGKTFKYTANGAVGLLNGKKALHIQASGGVYSEGPASAVEYGNRHLKAVLGFYGITDVETIFVEGQNAFPDRAAEIKAAAIEKAQQLAKTF